MKPFTLLLALALPAALSAQGDLTSSDAPSLGDAIARQRALAKVRSTTAVPVGGAPSSDCLTDAPAPPAPDASSRIDGRNFPSVFQAWTVASNISGMSANVDRHGLVWSSPWAFGLKSDNDVNRGLATRYDALTLAHPHTVILAEVRWHDATYAPDKNQAWLPGDSAWWLRGPDGAMKPANGTGTVPVYFLDYHNACFQQQVVRQCQASIRAGFDGCMLDWWHPDADMQTMLKRVRAGIGGALLIVNSNGDVPPDLSDANGVFAEGFGAWFFHGGQGGQNGSPVTSPPGADAWNYLIRDLRALEKGARAPRINAIEGWGDEGSKPYLRGLTTLVLVYSDAYVLYSRPNMAHPDPAHPDQPHDHWHFFGDFWSPDLGPSTEPAQDPASARVLAGTAVVRRFANGVALFNPAAAPTSVPEDLLLGQGYSRSRVAGPLKRGAALTIGPFDGDIVLR